MAEMEQTRDVADFGFGLNRSGCHAMPINTGPSFRAGQNLQRQRCAVRQL